jgi:Ulp1 family protease
MSDLILDSKYGSIKRFQLLELVSNKGKNLICTDIIDAYLKMLCDHANGAVNNTGASREAKKKVIFHSIDVSFYDLIHTPDSTYFPIASKTLTKKGLHGTNFFSAKLIFLPIDIPIGGPAGHGILLVISPRQKIMSIYDSWRPQNYSRSTYIIRCVCRFLEYHLGTLFVESEWKMRHGLSPWQRNKVDCGIFVCANAMCALFGWKHNFNQKDIKAMRKKMVMEFLNGRLEGFGFPGPDVNMSDGRGFERTELSVLRALPQELWGKINA